MGNIFLDSSVGAVSESVKLNNTLTSGGIFIGSAANVATDMAVTGDMSMTNTGVTTVASSAITAGKMSSNAGTWVFNGQLIGQGANTNSNAAVGYIGEYASTAVSTFVNVPGATTVWADMIPLTLTAGDWDVNVMTTLKLNGAVMTAFDFGISSTSGNSATGLAEGDNWVQSAALPIGAVHQAEGISGYRQSLSQTTTLYAKLNVTYSAGNPQYACRFSARRMR